MATPTTNIGLQLVEGISAGITNFREPSKRNIGLVMERERGVPGKVFEINTLDDDRKYFGDPVSGSYGGWIVRYLAKNASPAPFKIFGTRIIGSSSVAATNSYAIPSGPTVVATAGYRGDSDPGTWGNNLSYNFYSYDYKLKNLFVLEVLYKGAIVETFSNATCAGLVSDINKRSGYIKITISAEWAVAYTALTGTATTLTNSAIVVGVGTAFTTEVSVGMQLYDNSVTPVYLGRVQSIEDNTHLTLQGNALAAVTGATIKKRVDTTVTKALSTGTYVAPVESDFYPVSSPTAPKGLALMDGINIQLLAVTENHTLTMAQQGKTYCTNRADCIFIAQLPLNADEQIIELFANTLQTNTRNFIAGYADWDKVYNDSGDIITIPGIGRILGAAYLRVPFLQGDHIHIPPGGIDSAAVDLIDLAAGKFSQDQINRFVRNYTTNVSSYSDNYGRFIMTSRMYSTNPLYMSVHINMQTNFYVRVLLDNLLFILQKNNSPQLKKEVIVRITDYFLKEYEKGALEKSLKFEEAFKVTCDQTNNPLNQDRKILNVAIDYIPSECVESVRISLNRNDALLTAKVS